MDVLSFHPDVTFLVGENGTGKSTLIEAIALVMGFGPEGGPKNVQFATAETVSPLYKYRKAVKSFKKPRDHYFLRAESFYNVATYMDQIGLLEGYGAAEIKTRGANWLPPSVSSSPVWLRAAHDNVGFSRQTYGP
ncbi:MAG: AAA family ATPase [Syntrophobacteraceae bacterium]|jgi:predicted ATPase